MLEQAITEIQNIERSVTRKNALGSTNSLGFTLLPQGIARVVRRVPPPRVSSLATNRRPAHPR